MQDNDLYTLAELGYKKMCSEIYPDLKEEDIYPLNWILVDNIPKKIEILSESIESKKLIKDTNLYNNLNTERCRVTEINK